MRHLTHRTHGRARGAAALRVRLEGGAAAVPGRCANSAHIGTSGRPVHRRGREALSCLGLRGLLTRAGEVLACFTSGKWLARTRETISLVPDNGLARAGEAISSFASEGFTREAIASLTSDNGLTIDLTATSHVGGASFRNYARPRASSFARCEACGTTLQGLRGETSVRLPVTVPVSAAVIPGPACIIAGPVRAQHERHDGYIDLIDVVRQINVSVVIEPFEIAGRDPAAIALPAYVAPRDAIQASVDVDALAAGNAIDHGKTGARACSHAG
jgi:hypothetical protein